MSKQVQLFYNFQLVNHDFKGFIQDCAMIVTSGKIFWVGEFKDLPNSKKIKIFKKTNLQNKKVFPSFIECHTHSIFAGTRADEFELRNSGVSYLEIAAKGGGILSTVKETRKVSATKLLKESQKRINIFLKQGVSTVEIKSGYGLDLETEIKILNVAKKIKGPRIVTTFLGAHAKPNEFDSYQEYLNYILKNVLPVLKIKKLTNRVDIFIEKGFFEADAAIKYLQEFKKQGFDIVVHANQMSESGGVEAAILLNAKSADHVICLNEKNIFNLSKTKTVAVLLPTADLYMNCDYPQARKLIDSGVSVALATDFNPGSSPTQDLMLVGLLARLKMKMSLSEVFMAYTIHAARALGIESSEGTLEKNKYANFICTESDLSDFFYSAGSTPKHDLFIRGNKIKLR